MKNPMLNKHDPSVKDLVQKLIDHFMYIKILHYSYKALFEDTSFLKQMENAANPFFLSLNELYVNSLLLLFAKIMDPPYVNYRNNTMYNLTLNYFFENIDWSENEKINLKKILDKCKSFSKLIKPARDKAIAHNDIATLKFGISLGKFEIGRDEEYLNDIEDFCNLLHEYVFGHICGKFIVSQPGDVMDFKKVIQLGNTIKTIIGTEYNSNNDKEFKRRILNEVMKCEEKT